MTVNKISNINNTQTAPVQAVPQKAAQTNIQKLASREAVYLHYQADTLMQ